ncbi:hypothetical protein [Moorena sp. SIO4G3]|uniref:hypothetical protein n=1 Tax=Moorena sp. SIO4G3 TaxID=2607821 RepID=UPI0025E022C9|nr:hypothetical protein [Moorena sp. SIO4G3]
MALLNSGVSPLTALLYSLIPQAFLNLLSYTVYRFDCAIRSATVLGIIGAGGLGYQMFLSLQSLRYEQLWTFFYVLSFPAAHNFILPGGLLNPNPKALTIASVQGWTILVRASDSPTLLPSHSATDLGNSSAVCPVSWNFTRCDRTGIKQPRYSRQINQRNQ